MPWKSALGCWGFSVNMFRLQCRGGAKVVRQISLLKSGLQWSFADMLMAVRRRLTQQLSFIADERPTFP